MRVRFSSIILGMLLGSTTAAFANAQSSLVWSDKDGFIEVKSCTYESADDIPLRVSKYYSDSDESQSYEALISQPGSAQYSLPNNSLVATIGSLVGGDSQQVEVLGTSINANYQHSNSTAQRGYGSPRATTELARQNLYIYHKSLEPLDNYLFEVLEVEGVRELPGSAYPLANSYWRIARDQGGYLLNTCCLGDECQDYFVFDVFVDGGEDLELITQVGVPRAETKIFDKMTGWSFDDITLAPGKEEVSEESSKEAQDAQNKASSQPQATTGGSAAPSKLNNSKQNNNDRDENTTKPTTDPSQGDENSKNSDKPTRPDASSQGTSQTADSSSVDSTPPPQPRPQSHNIEIHEGDYEFVACSSEPVPLQDDTLDLVLSQVNPYEPVVLFQDFGRVETKEKSIDGILHKFQKVQLPDQENLVGWISTSIIKHPSKCEGYRAMLRQDVEIICTRGRGLQVRDDSMQVLFTATQHTVIDRRPDWRTTQRTEMIGEAQHNMIPINFVHTNKTGWVSDQYLSTRQNCTGFQETIKGPVAGANNAMANPNARVSRLDDTACCYFPMRYEPPDYTIEGTTPAFGSGRANTDRLHAAADLYSPPGVAVYAVADGTILHSPSAFAYDTWIINVRHPGGFIVRYGEVSQETAQRWSDGATVRKGQKIAEVGLLDCPTCAQKSMLHFELYSGTARGNLTRRGEGQFHRRSDLIDPTNYLRKWQRAALGWAY